MKQINPEDIVVLGEGLWRYKTPEEKAIDKLKKAGAKEPEKAISLLSVFIK